MKYLFTLLLLTVLSYATIARRADNPGRLPDELVQFFAGNWKGEGAFANGRKIAAGVSFKLALDSSWLSYEHTDEAPNRYKAFSFWGTDKQTGQFLAYTFDNFHGHRQFATDGWKNGKLVLTTQEYYAGKGILFQHFIYEKLDERTFKMTYETSTDGIAWKMGDYLVFTKQ